jgi:hypothetical protein
MLGVLSSAAYGCFTKLSACAALGICIQLYVRFMTMSYAAEKRNYGFEQCIT